MAIYGCLINNMLTLDNVDRIEINRGSESVLYGSDGLGGVINIITREPEKLGAGMTLRGGANSTVISSLEHENTFGNTGYFLSGMFKRSDGYRGDADFADDSGFFKIAHSFNESVKLESSLTMYNNRSNDPGTVLAPTTDFWADIKRRQADVTLSAGGKTSMYRLKMFHNEGHHVFAEKDGWQSRDMISGFKAEMVKEYAEGKNRLIVGADGQRNAGKALVDNDKYLSSGFKFWLNNKEWFSENEGALFAADKHTFMNGKLSLIGGARLVRNSAYGTFFCPKAGAVLRLDDTKVHVGYNRGFKNPSLLQTHLHKMSNPDLKPEIADNAEIGADRTLISSLSAGTTLFYTRGTDKVEMKLVDGIPQGFGNIGEWKHKGAELTLHWLPSNHFVAYAGYTYLDAGSNTQYNPKHQGNLNLRTSWNVLKRELVLTLNGLAISGIYAGNNHESQFDDFVVLDVFADWRIHRYGSLILGIDNLLDRKYEAVQGYPMPGAVFTAGIRLER